MLNLKKPTYRRVYEAIKLQILEQCLKFSSNLVMESLEPLPWEQPKGLKRGLTVSRTNAPISVPVGEKTLGRIMDVLGNPIDECGPIGAEEKMPIHRKPPSYMDQSLIR